MILLQIIPRNQLPLTTFIATKPPSSLTWIAVIASYSLLFHLFSLIVSPQRECRRVILNISQMKSLPKPCNGSHFTYRQKAKVPTMTDLVWAL